MRVGVVASQAPEGRGAGWQAQSHCVTQPLPSCTPAKCRPTHRASAAGCLYQLAGTRRCAQTTQTSQRNPTHILAQHVVSACDLLLVLLVLLLQVSIHAAVVRPRRNTRAGSAILHPLPGCGQPCWRRGGAARCAASGPGRLQVRLAGVVEICTAGLQQLAQGVPLANHLRGAGADGSQSAMGRVSRQHMCASMAANLVRPFKPAPGWAAAKQPDGASTCSCADVACCPAPPAAASSRC